MFKKYVLRLAKIKPKIANPNGAKISILAWFIGSIETVGLINIATAGPTKRIIQLVNRSRVFCDMNKYYFLPKGFPTSKDRMFVLHKARRPGSL